MNSVSCQIDLQGRPAEQGLTVGDKFLLSCDGELSAPLKDNVQFQFLDEAQKYTLHVLKVQESMPQSFKLIVTSYKPGEYTNQKLMLSDGVEVVTTNEISWRVGSVLDPNQEPKLEPSQGPFMISYPLWFWLALAALLALIFSFFGFFIYRKKKKKKLKEHLESYATMLPPFSQFSRDMRAARRTLDHLKSGDGAVEIIKKLDEDFKLFLIRELKVPALQFSDAALLKDIKREHPDVYTKYKADLRRILSEFTNAKSDLNRIKIKDCEDLSFLSQQMAEKIHNMKRKLKEK